jgi:hypothetical protein
VRDLAQPPLKSVERQAPYGDPRRLDVPQNPPELFARADEVEEDVVARLHAPSILRESLDSFLLATAATTIQTYPLSGARRSTRPPSL